jgi:hypothetical protein
MPYTHPEDTDVHAAMLLAQAEACASIQLFDCHL